MTDPEYIAAIEIAREQGAQAYKEHIFKAIEMFCDLPDGAIKDSGRIVPIKKGQTHSARQLFDYLKSQIR